MVFAVIIYALVQAATEFLPVSSSGHLVLLHRVLPLGGLDELQFDVALHWGTLAAVVIAFRNDLRALVRGWLRSLGRRAPAGPEGRLAWLILIGNIVPVTIGGLFGERITESTRTVEVVIASLAAGALLLLAADHLGRRSRSLDSLTAGDAVLIGASQALAFIPGVSRSGITIITALFRNIHRVAAVRFSFLLSVPIIAAAGVKELSVFLQDAPDAATVAELLVGFVAAALFGYVVIRFLLRFVERHTFRAFAVYRLLLALLMLTIR